VSTSDIVVVGVAIVLFAIVGFLALAETALTRMSLAKALALQEERHRGAATVVRLVEHPERWLNPLLFVTLLLNFAAASMVAHVVGRYFGALGAALVVLGEALVVFVVAEAVPKTWAIQHGQRAALVSAPIVAAVIGAAPMRILARSLIAISNALIPGAGLKEGPFVSEEELLAMADVAEAEDVIEDEERELIHSIIEFGDTVVREVRVPRPDMVAVEGRDRVSDVLEVAIAAGYSRIPVYEQGIDDIVGIVYVKDLVRAARDGRSEVAVRELIRPAHFVPETKRVSELMREMQREKFHMAIVVDEYGGTSGLVTLEDLIEELVGEIVDEFDVEEPQVEWLPNGDSRVNARMPVDELNELLHAELPEGDWDSVGGLMLDLLGHVPAEGESVVFDGHQLIAERVQGRRIGRVRITRVEGPEGAQVSTLPPGVRLSDNPAGKREVAGDTPSDARRDGGPDTGSVGARTR
jgi:CBS domain containing-hemolysin-like protein